MNCHRARADQWAMIEKWAEERTYECAYESCLIELRDRLDALEAKQREAVDPACPHIVSTDEGTSYCGLNMPGQPSQSAAAPSITNCHLSGPAPSPYGSWSEWFEAEGSKGVIHGIRMESLPLRSSAQQEIADAEAFGLASTSGSLVDQVAILLAKPGNCTWDGMAVDVIRAVAAWLRDRGFTWVAQTLEKEANQ